MASSTDLPFRDATVWITGASSGIGEALAYEWAAQGARLILSARRTERLEAVRQACTRPDAHHVLPLDLADPASLPAAAASAQQLAGRLDILVHNGGISQRGLAAETDLEVDRRIMEVNYFGAVGLTKAVLPTMLAQGTGRFVVVSSLVGLFGTAQRTAYAASKHALHGFFDSLRAEVYDAGLRVTLVCPGFIRTDITRHALTGDGQPFGKMGDAQAHGMPPDQCAEAILQAVRADRDEVYIGGREVLGVYLKRLSPALFNRFIRRAETT